MYNSIFGISNYSERGLRNIYVGAKNLNLCILLEVPFFNNNASEEKKAWGKAP